MNETKTYALADWLDNDECVRCGACDANDRTIRAVATGKTRPPKAGEWYLSGATVGAYRAKNDLSTAYPIARLVRVDVQHVRVETIVGKY